MAAGDTFQHVNLLDQWIFDADGDMVGIRNPRVNGNDLRFDESTGAANVDWIHSVTGAVERSVESRLRDTLHVGDVALAASADVAGYSVFVPTAGATTTVANGAALVAMYKGDGQLTTADGNKRGKYFSTVKAAPSSFGNHDSVETAFNGDLRHSIFQIEHRITGAATLGQPTTGYHYTPETAGIYLVGYNSSGYNHALDSNTGRTAATLFRGRLHHYGQADGVVFNASVFVAGTKAGSTDFLANPAGILFNGDIQAGADGVYLNPFELYLYDAGYDVAATGLVLNMYRSNNAGAKSAIWNGLRIQGIGTAAGDAIVSATGPWVTGIDFSPSTTDFGANKAAISLRAGQRIYLNNTAGASGALKANWRATTFSDFIEYSAANAAISFGSSTLMFGTAAASVATPSTHKVPIKLADGSTFYLLGTT